MKEKLLEELTELSPVSQSSAKAYHEHMTFLLDRVNKKMASRPCCPRHLRPGLLRCTTA